MKIVIIVLVVIGLLFVGTIVLGATQEDGGPAVDRHSLVQSLKDLFVAGPTPVDVTDLSSATCPVGNPLVLSPGQLCEFEIAESSAFRRELILRIDQGTASFSFSQEGQITVRRDLTPERNQVKVNVTRDAGTWSLVCSSALGCSVSLPVG